MAFQYTDKSTGATFRSDTKLDPADVQSRFAAMAQQPADAAAQSLIGNEGAQPQPGEVADSYKDLALTAAKVGVGVLPIGRLARGGLGAGMELGSELVNKQPISPTKIAVSGLVDAFFPGPGKSVASTALKQGIAGAAGASAFALADGRVPTPKEMLAGAAVAGGAGAFLRWWKPGVAASTSDATAAEAYAQKSLSEIKPENLRTELGQFRNRGDARRLQTFQENMPEYLQAPVVKADAEPLAIMDHPILGYSATRWNDILEGIQNRTGAPTYDFWRKMRGARLLVEKAPEAHNAAMSRALEGVKYKDYGKLQQYLEAEPLHGEDLATARQRVAQIAGIDKTLQTKAEQFGDIYKKALEQYGMDADLVLPELGRIRRAAATVDDPSKLLKAAYPVGSIPKSIEPLRGAIETGNMDFSHPHVLRDFLATVRSGASYTYMRPVREEINTWLKTPDLPEEVAQPMRDYLDRSGNSLGDSIGDKVAQDFANLVEHFGGGKLSKAQIREYVGLLNTAQYSGTIGGRTGPVVKNGFNGFQTGAPVVGNRWYAKGVGKALTVEGKARAAALGANEGMTEAERALEASASIAPRFQAVANQSMKTFSHMDVHHNNALTLAVDEKIKYALKKSAGDVDKFMDLADLDLMPKPDQPLYRQMFKEGKIEDITKLASHTLTYDTQWSRMVERIPALSGKAGHMLPFTTWPTHYLNYLRRYFIPPGEDWRGVGNLLKDHVSSLPGLKPEMGDGYTAMKRAQNFRRFIYNNAAIGAVYTGVGTALGLPFKHAAADAAGTIGLGPVMSFNPWGGPLPSAVTKADPKQLMSLIPRYTQVTRDIPLALDGLATGDTSKMAEAFLGYSKPSSKKQY